MFLRRFKWIDCGWRSSHNSLHRGYFRLSMDFSNSSMTVRKTNLSFSMLPSMSFCQLLSFRELRAIQLTKRSNVLSLERRINFLNQKSNVFVWNWFAHGSDRSNTEICNWYEILKGPDVDLILKNRKCSCFFSKRIACTDYSTWILCSEEALRKLLESFHCIGCKFLLRFDHSIVSDIVMPKYGELSHFSSICQFIPKTRSIHLCRL
jgi:hypothetical protein